MLSDQLLGKEKQAALAGPTIVPPGEQAEWFLLALSSYKLKKYGECLYAVSKTARRNTDVVADQASCGRSTASGQ